MRKQFRDTTVDLLDKDERLVVLLGDIGVHSFFDALKLHSDRVMNLGILEQGSIGVGTSLPDDATCAISFGIEAGEAEAGAMHLDYIGAWMER